jgi:Nucleotidyl transferase AbiEii toxin, Type IV TA system
MAKEFLSRANTERREALNFAASETGRPANLLEKDTWVVKALDVLFTSDFAPHLVFKGGTALSKVHHVIQRFSEDVDVTYDIRELAPDESAKAMEELDVIPENRSQENKLSELIRKDRLPTWIKERMLPIIQENLGHYDGVQFRHDSETIFIDYPPVIPPSDYARPTVRLEFGGRSTGEPASPHFVTCDMAPLLPRFTFPTATPRTMDISRVFWEKATAIHVYCLQGKEKMADRFSRHLYDLARLRETGHATEAITARSVAETVARHKGMFFRMKAADGSNIDYEAAIRGALILIPNGGELDALRADYNAMLAEGLLPEYANNFDALIAQCTELQTETNANAGA